MWRPTRWVGANLELPYIDDLSNFVRASGLDESHIPTEGDPKLSSSIFVAKATDAAGTTTVWVPYTRPRGANFLAGTLIGGGGSGGGGQTGATNIGAGGGGSSSVTRFLALWDMLPEQLWLQVGRGGLDPAGNTAGNAGQLSYISVAPVNFVSENIIAISGAAAAGGGASGGTGGTAGTIAAATNMKIGNGGSFISWQSIVGLAGTAGGNAAAGTSATIWSGSASLCMPGTGGGGSGAGATDFAGGAISAIGIWPTLPGGVAGGGNGQHGYAPRMYTGRNRYGIGLLHYGGTGGGSADLGTGGIGGNGYIGCGGGGGGGGTTGGRGGRGGDGIIILASW